MSDLRVDYRGKLVRYDGSARIQLRMLCETALLLASDEYIDVEGLRDRLHRASAQLDKTPEEVVDCE